MIYTRLPLSGIDVPIAALQEDLFEGLKCAWQLDEDQYESYGRVYRNPTKTGFIPEVYTGDGNYRELFLDDRYAVLSFFGEGPGTSVSGGYNVAQVHAVFFVHLGATSALPSRADAEARADAQAIMGQNLHGFTIAATNSVVHGVASALTEYRITKGAGGSDLKAGDMHPFHCFRINGTIRYLKPQPQL